MTTDNIDNVSRIESKNAIQSVNWTRLEGIVAIGVLLSAFLWFLGMTTGMAIAVGFGLVLLLDFIRQLIFGSSDSISHNFSPSKTID